MSDTRLIVVPPNGEPARELAPRQHLYRMVRPHEPVWAGEAFTHAVVPEALSGESRVTGCGIEIPDPQRIDRACDLPGRPWCPAFECFGEM